MNCPVGPTGKLGEPGNKCKLCGEIVSSCKCSSS